MADNQGLRVFMETIHPWAPNGFFQRRAEISMTCMGAYLYYPVQLLTYMSTLSTRKIGGKNSHVRLRLRLRLQGAFTRLQKLCKRGSLNRDVPIDKLQNWVSKLTDHEIKQVLIQKSIFTVLYLFTWASVKGGREGTVAPPPP